MYNVRMSFHIFGLFRSSKLQPINHRRTVCFSFHIQLVKNIPAVFKIFSQIADMTKKLEQWKNLRVLYYDVYITGKDADFMFKKVQDVIKSENPSLFNSTDRQMLSQGVFTQDLSQLSIGMLNFSNLRDNARELVGSAVDVSRTTLTADMSLE